jgi:hypothetical protein
MDEDAVHLPIKQRLWVLTQIQLKTKTKQRETHLVIKVVITSSKDELLIMVVVLGEKKLKQKLAKIILNNIFLIMFRKHNYPLMYEFENTLKYP